METLDKPTMTHDVNGRPVWLFPATPEQIAQHKRAALAQKIRDAHARRAAAIRGE